MDSVLAPRPPSKGVQSLRVSNVNLQHRLRAMTRILEGCGCIERDLRDSRAFDSNAPDVWTSSTCSLTSGALRHCHNPIRIQDKAGKYIGAFCYHLKLAHSDFDLSCQEDGENIFHCYGDSFRHTNIQAEDDRLPSYKYQDRDATCSDTHCHRDYNGTYVMFGPFSTTNQVDRNTKPMWSMANQLILLPKQCMSHQPAQFPREMALRQSMIPVV